MFKYNFLAFCCFAATPLLGAGENLALVDPHQAPEPIRQQVEGGWRIMIATGLHAPQYSGDSLSCTNCHFAGGNTLGGKNNGISLVGVYATYPRYSERDGKEISLPERINSCFERSLNGHPLPHDSPLMQQLISYLKWISTPVLFTKQYPWLGLQQIDSKALPNPDNGEKLYSRYCSECHGSRGEGTHHEGALDMPPLWGDKAFNDGAGMHTQKTLAAFIYENMPYTQASLTPEQAQDIAAYIRLQPRPKYLPGID